MNGTLITAENSNHEITRNVSHLEDTGYLYDEGR